MTIWFTSDTHFGHKNVMKYAHRPFASVEEMDGVMIANWNSRVKPGDNVYHLGDVSFYRPETTTTLLRRLNGQKFLILGNHDGKMNTAFKARFTWIKDLYTLKVPLPSGIKQSIILCHYPLRSWNRMHYGAWHLHGHCHGNLQPAPGLFLDVGVDVHKYTPISFEEVGKIMAAKSFIPVDHHGRLPNV